MIKRLLLTTTILTSLNNITLADSNNDYYFKLQPEIVGELISSENSTTQKTIMESLNDIITPNQDVFECITFVKDSANTFQQNLKASVKNPQQDVGNLFINLKKNLSKIDLTAKNSVNISQGIKLEFGKYLNDYFALGFSCSFLFNTNAGSNLHANAKLMPKLNLIAYESDNIIISLGAGVGYHITGGWSLGLNGLSLGASRGLVGETNFNISTKINSTTDIGLDLGVSYSKLSGLGLRTDLVKDILKKIYTNNVERILSELFTEQKWRSIGFSIGLSVKFSL